MKNLRSIRSFGVSIALVSLSGCTMLMMSDFNKATEIATLDLGTARAMVKTIDLPSGDAEIFFVVPDYECIIPMNGAIEIVILDASGATTKRNVRFSELTWPQHSNGCDPIGYLYSNESRPLKFTVSVAENPVKFVFNVTEVENPGRRINIWAIYNGRIPIERILGNKYRETGNRSRGNQGQTTNTPNING